LSQINEISSYIAGAVPDSIEFENSLKTNRCDSFLLIFKHRQMTFMSHYDNFVTQVRRLG